MPDENKPEEKGTTIVGNPIKKGVTIYDKNSKDTPQTQVEIEEEIRQQTGGPC